MKHISLCIMHSDNQSEREESAREGVCSMENTCITSMHLVPCMSHAGDQTDVENGSDGDIYMYVQFTCAATICIFTSRNIKNLPTEAEAETEAGEEGTDAQ